jgi:WXXGXW repeat (2 copies)
MLKRTLYTFFAAAAISAPALMAPAIVTPAAAQANLDISIGVPMAAPVEVIPAPRPGYLWEAGYWRWDHGHRYWEHGVWRDAHHRYWR